jgi:hypothetical protein
MILEDQLLKTRLDATPEFLLRLHEVLATWSLTDKPGLFLQARPAAAGGVSLDVDSKAVQDVLRNGAEGENQGWDNLEAPHLQPSLHGVTGVMNWSTPEWLVEAHRDGHILAGVWTFPVAPHSEILVIPGWYAQFFDQFFEQTAAVTKAGGVGGDFQVTATLVNAHLLRYAARLGGGQFRAAGEVCSLKNIQWMVHTAPIGTEEWTKLAKAMAAGIWGAYRARTR